MGAASGKCVSSPVESKCDCSPVESQYKTKISELQQTLTDTEHILNVYRYSIALNILRGEKDAFLESAQNQLGLFGPYADAVKAEKGPTGYIIDGNKLDKPLVVDVIKFRDVVNGQPKPSALAQLQQPLSNTMGIWILIATLLSVSLAVYFYSRNKLS